MDEFAAPDAPIGLVHGCYPLADRTIDFRIDGRESQAAGAGDDVRRDAVRVVQDAYRKCEPGRGSERIRHRLDALIECLDQLLRRPAAIEGIFCNHVIRTLPATLLNGSTPARHICSKRSFRRNGAATV